jgi:chromate transport protein ChrA
MEAFLTRISERAQNAKVLPALLGTLSKTWDLGFTAFGGPAVHFQILHRRFVDGLGWQGEKWLDEQTVSAIFQ